MPRSKDGALSGWGCGGAVLMSDGADEMILDGLEIGLERYAKQLQEFNALVLDNRLVSQVLVDIHDNEGWETIERIFWAFQFGYLIGVHSRDPPTPDVDENRGYQ